MSKLVYKVNVGKKANLQSIEEALALSDLNSRGLTIRYKMVYNAAILEIDSDDIEITYIIKIISLKQCQLSFSIEPVSAIPKELKNATDFDDYYQNFVSTLMYLLMKIANS